MVNGLFTISLKDATGEKSAAVRSKEADLAPDHGPQLYVGDEQSQTVLTAFDAVLERQPFCNPLVITGAGSVGKTLLAHGIADCWKRRYPAENVLITTGADFLRGYTNAVRSHNTYRFRRQFMKLGLLVIDDLQMLNHRASAQSQLAQLIDSMVRRGQFVVCTLPSTLAQAHGLEETLVSRLFGGLQLPLSAPSEESMLFLLDELASQRGIELDTTLGKLLIRGEAGCPSPIKTVPQLRRALIRLQMNAELSGSPITRVLIREYLKGEYLNQLPTCRDITSIVAKRLNVRMGDLKGKSRRQYLSRARGIAMMLCRTFTAESYTAIGKYFGGRDHSTVMNACEKTQLRLNSDAFITTTYQELRSIIEDRFPNSPIQQSSSTQGD